MRITFLVKSTDYSGGFRVIVTLARELLALGHDVVIAHPPRERTKIRKRLREFIQGEWRNFSRVRGSFLDGSGIDSVELPKSEIMSGRMFPDGDVVIATWWETAHWISRLDKRKGAKVYLVQGHEGLIPGQPRELVADSLRLPFHKITVSSWLQEIIREIDPLGTISVVANSVDYEQFSASTRAMNSRPVFGFLYSEVPIKGSDLAIAALLEAKKRNDSIRAVSFGHAHPSRTLPIPSWCVFQQSPSQDSLSTIYASADAWIFSSRLDGFGLPILEAMACGTPVLATPAGAARELINSNVGRLVEHEDVIGLTEAILEIAALREQEWLMMSDAARISARSYSWMEAAKKFEAALLNAVRSET